MGCPKSLLFLPPKQLSSCVAAGIFRDTRGVALGDADRFNFFPASPLVSVTHVIEGELQLVGDRAGRAQRIKPGHTKIMPRQFVLSPQDEPIVSWSAGPVVALTVGIYPDAWMQLGHGFGSEIVPDGLSAALSAFSLNQQEEASWCQFAEHFSRTWQKARSKNSFPEWSGSDRLHDWSRYLLNRLALAGPGRSVRTLERMIKRWSGQTRQSLAFYAAIENLHRSRVERPDINLSALASDAGYADQSHMGRALRRATGFSPAQLNRLIETEESFWCYRLMGERF